MVRWYGYIQERSTLIGVDNAASLYNIKTKVLTGVRDDVDVESGHFGHLPLEQALRREHARYVWIGLGQDLMVYISGK